jgi:succinate dehydrogenase / fumarate reductase, membrane anchor subunit
MSPRQMRTALGRAAGLGSAKEGVRHWWRERLTAIALVPLTLWFMASIILHSSNDYAGFVEWLKRPSATFMMILLLVALFSHTALGLDVIIKDYTHSRAKIPALILMRLTCSGLLAAGVLAVLRIVFRQ